MLHKILTSMLSGTQIQNQQIMKDLITTIWVMLQAEMGDLEKFEKFYSPYYEHSLEHLRNVSYRYDSETFVNILDNFDVKTMVNKLVPIHRRKASKNILDVIAKEYFKNYSVEITFVKETKEIQLQVFTNGESPISQEDVRKIFYKIKNRLLIAGMKKDIVVYLRVDDLVDAPGEDWWYFKVILFPSLDAPEEEMWFKVGIEEIYWMQKWFTVRDSYLDGPDRIFIDGPYTREWLEFYESWEVGIGVDDGTDSPGDVWGIQIDQSDFVRKALERYSLESEIEDFYFNQRWFTVGVDQLDSAVRLFDPYSAGGSVDMGGYWKDPLARQVPENEGDDQLDSPDEAWTMIKTDGNGNIIP